MATNGSEGVLFETVQNFAVKALWPAETERDEAGLKDGLPSDSVEPRPKWPSALALGSRRTSHHGRDEAAIMDQCTKPYNVALQHAKHHSRAEERETGRHPLTNPAMFMIVSAAFQNKCGARISRD
jgi:hypothetical protein